MNAPMFCMLLRKYIQSGNIVSVSQIGFERIVKITVESLDELKSKTTKDLIIEIMGRHSNIILTHEEDKIVDSIKRISLNIESEKNYTIRVNMGKPNFNPKNIPVNTNKEVFIKEKIPSIAIKSFPTPCNFQKFIYIPPIKLNS